MARRRTNRRAEHSAKRKSISHRSKVKKAAKDVHVGARRQHTRTVNAPSAW